MEQPNAGLGMATFLLGEPTYFDHGGIIQAPDERATRISGYAGMRAGAKLGHSAPRERCSAAE